MLCSSDVIVRVEGVTADNLLKRLVPRFLKNPKTALDVRWLHRHTQRKKNNVSPTTKPANANVAMTSVQGEGEGEIRVTNEFFNYQKI